MVVRWEWDLDNKMAKYEAILEEEEEKRKLIQKIKKLEREIEKLKATATKKEGIIDADCDCEIWS